MLICGHGDARMEALEHRIIAAGIGQEGDRHAVFQDPETPDANRPNLDIFTIAVDRQVVLRNGQFLER